MDRIEKAASYKQLIYEEIKAEIIKGRLGPGLLLNERKLAAELGVSRTPIREALQMLVMDDWVEIIPWRGVVVKPVSYRDMLEVRDMRMMLERKAAQILCPVITAAQLAELKQHIVNMQSSYDNNANAYDFTNADIGFHTFLATCTGNRLLMRWSQNLYDVVVRISIMVLNNKDRFKESIDEHWQIYNALSQGELSLVEQGIEQHLNHMLPDSEEVCRGAGDDEAI